MAGQYSHVEIFRSSLIASQGFKCFYNLSIEIRQLQCTSACRFLLYLVLTKCFSAPYPAIPCMASMCHHLGWLYSVDSHASLCLVVLVNSLECATVFNSFKIYRSLQNLCIRFHHLMACPKRQFVFHWPFTYFCGHDLVTPSKEMKIEMNKAHTEKRAEIN